MSNLEKDAARYRWLRDSNYELFREDIGEESEPGMIGAITMCEEGGEFGVAVVLDRHEIDTAIDAAMKKWPYNAPATH